MDTQNNKLFVLLNSGLKILYIIPRSIKYWHGKHKDIHIIKLNIDDKAKPMQHYCPNKIKSIVHNTQKVNKLW